MFSAPSWTTLPFTINTYLVYPGVAVTVISSPSQIFSELKVKSALGVVFTSSSRLSVSSQPFASTTVTSILYQPTVNVAGISYVSSTPAFVSIKVLVGRLNNSKE